MTAKGRQLGRYRLLDELGSGGMSVVYKGLDTSLDREVAVKVLHPHLAQKEEARKRLAREAKAVAKLHHPNILEVFDFSSEGSDDAYLVTEYIRGQTLRQFSTEHPFAVPEIAAMVVHTLADALAHAHEQGVIHRDLKPENAMVREDGVLKLMDFGIAKIVDRDERMTMTGALVGSPAHMAPEIIEGEEARAPSDVFSLGTMFYLFATGKLPFTGPNTTSVLKRILDARFDDPIALCPALSDELAAILGRCLARNPDERYPDAGALRDALAGYLAPLGLARVSEELTAYFSDPAGYPTQLKSRLAGTLLSRAEQAAAEKKTARALASLNQVLALEPENPRARALIDGMNRARRRRKQLGQLGKAAAVAFGVALLAAGGLALYRARKAHPAGVEAPVRDPRPVAVIPAPTPKPEPKPVEVARAAVPERPAEVRPAAAKLPSPPPRPAALPITVQVRPFGYVSIDGGPKTGEALALHALQAAPGRHRVTVSCELCDDEVETIDVRSGQENLFRLRAQLKPATIAFDVEPPTALVRAAGVARAAGETRAEPIEIVSAKGPTTLQHRVDYEISAPGYRTVRKSVAIAPGRLTVIEERLSPP